MGVCWTESSVSEFGTTGQKMDSWETVGLSVRNLLHRPWLISNLMHKILIYLHIIHLLKSSSCFEHYPAHLQEVYVVIVYMQPLVSSLCQKWVVYNYQRYYFHMNKCIYSHYTTTTNSCRNSIRTNIIPCLNSSNVNTLHHNQLEI